MRIGGSRIAACGAALMVCGIAGAQPAGFQDQLVFSGFSQPTAVRFAPDGRAFVLEKAGRIKAYDSVTDTTPTVFADLSSRLWNFHDHGLLGLAIDPGWPGRPYLYVLYSLRGVPGGRLSRLTANLSTNTMTGSELVLLENWAQVYPSHSIGDLAFGPEGALYLSAGEGASFSSVDWGQNEPYNPDGSPLGGIDVDDPPLEGGALRSQDLRSSADPLKYSGTVLRVHPDTGAAWPGNPLQGGSVDDDRILAYGLRNPFRFAVHPTRNDVWIADVGWDQWEEINRIPYPFASVLNFGWPAYEGVGRQWSYDNADLPLLESLYSQGGHTAPYYTYSHVGSSSVTGVVFYTGGDYPSQYVNALFFGDYARQWIKVMFPGANGLPDTGNIVTFVSSGAAVVDLQRGPGGDIYYVEINDGQVRRFDYLSGNQAPVAVCSANPTTGNAPLTVSFTGSNSYDPDPGDLLTYSWDLNADGTFGDSSAANPQYTYTQPGSYLVRLRVTDTGGASSTASLTISVNNLPPQPVILTPTEGTLWRVGDVISFSGSANDPETGTMPASALSWQVVLFHCFASDPTDCHEHTMLTLNGAASGQFTAIDHEYPAYLEIRLTATEPGPGGLSTTAVLPLLPETATYQFATNPPGLTLSVQSATGPTPFDQEFIVNGSVTVSAPSPQSLNGQSYTFVSWSDGGAQSHNFTATASGATLVANYQATNLPPVINRIGPKNVKEGALLAFQVSASDPNGTIPVLTAANLPSGATFTDNRNGTGNFSWVPPIGSSAGSPYNVTFTASDGALTASEVAQIRVRSAKSR